MTQRKTRARQEISNSAILAAIGWYDRAQWTELKEVADDADRLDDTYEDWLRNVEHLEQEMARKGVPTRRVMINVDSLIAWCTDRRKRLDGDARSAYAAELARGIG